ncbi:MAG: peptidase S41, partial [Pseudomonadota bacterium]
MRKTLLALLAGAAFGAALPQIVAVTHAQEDARSTYENLDLFGDIFERVRSTYVEEVDEQQLIESAINGMLA